MTTESPTAPVPVVCVEEHNELLVAMAWAIAHRGLPDAPVALLHVDQHADMDLPQVRRPLRGAGRDVAALRETVAGDIAISAFIWAGAYLGLIDEVFWLAPPPPLGGARPAGAAVPRRMFIATCDEARRDFVTAGIRRETEGLGNDDRRPLTLQRVGPGARVTGEGREPPRSWVLGIDLDYFSCNTLPVNGFRLEVTRATHDAVRDDRYHPLRLSPYHRVEAVADAAGLWLEFDMFTPRGEDLLVTGPEEIARRLAELRGLLAAQAWAPGLIVVARSRLSGFTPAHQWQGIERDVLAMLGTLYPCEIVEGDRLWQTAR